jgi:proteasome beta subunit
MEPRSARWTHSTSPVDAALPAAYFTPGSSSFTDFVMAAAPHLLPGQVPPGLTREVPGAGLEIVHGTTIVAATYDGGVLIAGDRRATMGNMIAQRDIEKVVITDNYSAIGIAGAAGMGVEMARLYTVDLEHYEKIEGVPLSLDGKVNKLAGMVRANLGAALQGFAVLPLFAGYDPDAAEPARGGRIVSFDVTGSKADEPVGYHAIGSGSLFARSALKKRHDPTADADTTIRVALEALYDAADDDTATGGPDLTRKIFPMVVTIDAAEGAVRRSDSEIGEVVRAVVADRLERPGG